MRSLSVMPWKPGITATSPAASDAFSATVSISAIRAEACASLVRIGSCQPSQLRAFTPIDCSTIASSPLVTCSPDATTTSYSRGSYSDEASRQNWTSRSVSPAIADTTTATWLPASASRFTRAATLRIRSIPRHRGAAELHDDTGHRLTRVPIRFAVTPAKAGVSFRAKPESASAFSDLSASVGRHDRHDHPQGSGAFRRDGRRLVEPERLVGDAAPAQSGAPQLSARAEWTRIGAPTPRRGCRWRAGVRWTWAAAPGCSLNRSPGWARR